MGAAKPTLGYPSRTAAVLALRGQGLSDVEIGERIGIGQSAVSALACSYERDLSRKRDLQPAGTHGRNILIPRTVLVELLPHAGRRGISINDLVRRIVEAVATDHLVDAVLDDGRNG